MESNIERLNTEIEELKKQMDDNNTKHSTEIGKLNTTIAELIGKNEALQTGNGKLNARIDGLSKIVDSLIPTPNTPTNASSPVEERVRSSEPVCSSNSVTDVENTISNQNFVSPPRSTCEHVPLTQKNMRQLSGD